MAGYRDLEPLTYFGSRFAEVLVAIGWLSRHQAYAKGPTNDTVYERLTELLVKPYQPVVAMGSHECELCEGSSRHMGRANLFVPANGMVFVCPELIIHYIDIHNYQPPQEFCDAVLECPDTHYAHGREYLRMLSAFGIPIT